MTYSAALTRAVSDGLVSHLVREDGQEDLAFAVYYPSSGTRRFTGLVSEVLLPTEEDRRIHGNVEFMPAYLERALDYAASSGGGLAFLHSHPFPGWQSMSRDDVHAEQMIAPRARAATGLPLLGLTAGSDSSWSARFWNKTGPREYQRDWCETVRVLGRKLITTYNDELMPVPKLGEELSRTVSAWGPLRHLDLVRLRVCVVGCGSVGALVAEGLARMGIANITLVDFDRVRRVNRDRLLFSKRAMDLTMPFKADVLAAELHDSSTAGNLSLRVSHASVCEHEGFAEVLGSDIIFCCVDRPWPRQVLNLISKAHLIPVIDGGIYLRTLDSGAGMRHADWTVDTVTPETACMECLGQFSPEDAALDKEGFLDDPVYVEGLPKNHPFRMNANVFGFSMAVAAEELLHFIALTVAPSCCEPRATRRRFVHEGSEELIASCKPQCLFQGILAKGDRCGVVLTGGHPAAEKARLEMAARLPLPCNGPA